MTIVLLNQIVSKIILTLTHKKEDNMKNLTTQQALPAHS